MTFSVCRDRGAFEWSGTNADTLFCQRRNIFSPRMWRIIFDILRFNQFALDLIGDDASPHDATSGESIGQYLEREGYSDAFRDDYLIPMTAAVWSTSPDKCLLEFPAITLVRFLCVEASCPVSTEKNETVLHADTSLLPTSRKAWASWNYLSLSSPNSQAGNVIDSVSLTYNMNILQHIPADVFGDVLVTLNPLSEPDPDTVQGRYKYNHPLFTAASVRAQQLLPRIQNKRGISYAGAWTKYGFHEDGFSSGLVVAVRHLGARLPFEFVDSTFSRGHAPERGVADRLLRIVLWIIQVNYAVSVILGTVALSYGSVPMYKMICQTTGWGGQPVRAPGHGGIDGDGNVDLASRLQPVTDAKRMRVTFNASVSDVLPWKFVPQQREVRVLPGETALAFYTATNKSDKDIIGVATYSVTPAQVAPYFSKIQCFCFEEQRLSAGETVDMPVFFYLDPDMLNDLNMKGVETVTLSYTFFKAKYDDNGKVTNIPQQ
ncbi:Cytochrome c oxidase assembly protein cox11, mitochondrial [Sporothrix bragantina]|uniref:Cytochrome c oxidase assembly protein cox11, mitochondrial n=2 Tax=Sporothrix TaxID=29907 RepID=A0ABP0CZS9_9PEZI